MDSFRGRLGESGAASSPRVQALEEEVQQDADEMNDNKNWKAKRKSLKQRQYKYDNQQKY